MSIRVTNGFEVRAAQPIDTRILLTKAEMLALKAALVPDNYFCICKDDGKLYIYNKTFESDPEMGKFKSYEEVMNIADAINKALTDPTSETAQQLQKAVADTVSTAMTNPESEAGQKMTEAISATIPSALEETMSTSEGAQKVADALFDSEHFETTLDNKIDLAVSVIQAIGNVE